MRKAFQPSTIRARRLPALNEGGLRDSIGFDIAPSIYNALGTSPATRHCDGTPKGSTEMIRVDAGTLAGSPVD